VCLLKVQVTITHFQSKDSQSFLVLWQKANKQNYMAHFSSINHFFDLIAYGSKVQNIKNYIHILSFSQGTSTTDNKRGDGDGRQRRQTANEWRARSTADTQPQPTTMVTATATTTAELFTERTATGDAAAEQASLTCATRELSQRYPTIDNCGM